MAQEAWWALVIGVSGLVAIVLAALVMYGLQRPPSGRSTSPGSAQPSRPPAGRTVEQSRRVGLPAAFRRPRQLRSVEGNFERAFARIDAVDPFLAQRRIGEALADVGLLSSPSVFDDPLPSGQDQPPGVVTERSHRWEDEA